MPFKVVAKGDKFKLYNLDKKRYAKPTYNTRQSAKNAASNFMRYDTSKVKKSKYNK
jgi:hypothetical protein